MKNMKKEFEKRILEKERALESQRKKNYSSLLQKVLDSMDFLEKNQKLLPPDDANDPEIVMAIRKVAVGVNFADICTAHDSIPGLWVEADFATFCALDNGKKRELLLALAKELLGLL